VACANFTGRARMLRFESVIQLEHAATELLDFPVAAHAEFYPFAYDQEDMPDLLRSIERQYPDPMREVASWAAGFTQRGGPIRTADLLAGITQAIHRDFTYVRREERGIQDPLLTLKLGSGSCRDFALLMMEATRSLGFAARFVSGYLYVPNDDPKAQPAARAGGGSTHAWVQVYLPGAGWLEFDPTNGIVGNHDLIRVAIARDPAQAVPLWGSWTGFPSDSLGLTVEVTVTASAMPSRHSRRVATPAPPVPPPARQIMPALALALKG
jgi:transglutaminase-like putative cysteine protease